MCLCTCLSWSLSELCYLGFDPKGYHTKKSNDIKQVFLYEIQIYFVDNR